MSNPLITVIIPTRNRVRLLEHALDSVRNQTYRPLEIIVVDDDSTDDTSSFVADWRDRHADEHLQIKIVFSRSRNANAARNLGVESCSGEYIQFLDSDDTLDPGKLEQQADHFSEQPDLEMSIGQVRSDCGQKVLHTHRPYTVDEIERLSIIWSPFSSLGPVVRRQSLKDKNLQWDETLDCCQDWEYFTRLIQRGLSFDYCLTAIAYIRSDDGRERAGHHPSSPSSRFVKNRLRQLASLWNHANEGTRVQMSFKLPFFMQVCQLTLSKRAERVSFLGSLSDPVSRFVVLFADLCYRVPLFGRKDVPRRIYYRLQRLLA